MILTQTFRDLGQPTNFLLIGLFVCEVEPTDEVGYGVSFKALHEAAHQVLLREHNDSAVVLNAKFEYLPSRRAHPGYNRRILRVTGDLYHRK